MLYQGDYWCFENSPIIACTDIRHRLHKDFRVALDNCEMSLFYGLRNDTMPFGRGNAHGTTWTERGSRKLQKGCPAQRSHMHPEYL